jgi:hypothetical protein
MEQKPVIGFGKRLNRHIHQINNSHASSVGCFHYGLDFVQPDGKINHLELDNLIPDAGLRYLGGGTAFEGMATYSEFFFVLYTIGRAPQQTDTMANLPEYGELVTGTDRTSRQRWDFTRTGGTYDSSGNPALYTVTAASVEVRGIMLCTQQAYLSTDGILLSARLLDSPEIVRQGGFIRATATHTFQRGT